MPQLNFPAEYNQVMPYIIVKDAAGFMRFMQDVFGATEKLKHMRDEHIIQHAEVTIGESVIMFADTIDAYGVTNASMYVYVADADAAFNKAMELGSKLVMPMGDQSYGRSGGLTDPYGNTWWITTHK